MILHSFKELFFGHVQRLKRALFCYQCRDLVSSLNFRQFLACSFGISRKTGNPFSVWILHLQGAKRLVALEYFAKIKFQSPSITRRPQHSKSKTKYSSRPIYMGEMVVCFAIVVRDCSFMKTVFSATRQHFFCRQMISFMVNPSISMSVILANQWIQKKKVK